MLNVRLYRLAWVVAAVGILLLLLTLQAPASVPAPPVPPAITGAAIDTATQTVQTLGPTRAPGSAGDRAVAAWVHQQFTAMTGIHNAVIGRATVGGQSFVARWRGRLVHGTNVFLSLPGSLTGASQLPAIVITAPRDAPPGVTTDASSTGMLVALAQLSANTTHQRPLIFVSLDASTVGNAGMRWFLPKVTGVRIGAVINIASPAQSPATDVWVWDGGRDNAQALALDSMARTAVARAGAVVTPRPGLGSQLLRLAVPQTFGDQAPAISAGIPAVTIAGRPDTPRYGPVRADQPQLGVIGDGILSLAGSLDAATSIPGPSGAVYVASRELGDVAVRMILVLLIFPVLVVSVDVAIRLRRARIRWRPGVTALGFRVVPWLVASAIGVVLARAGLMPGMSAGAVPLPGDAPILVRSLVALAAIGVSGLVISIWSASRIARLSLIPASDVAASLVGLGLMLALAWVMRPFMLVLVVIGAHAAVLALTASRRRQLAYAVIVAVLPVFLLVWSVSDQLQRSWFYAAWYLLVTTFQGGRGGIGPVIAVVLVVCAGSVVAVADRRLRNVPQIPAPPVWDVTIAWLRNVWEHR
jgi:hypothetical protein